MLTLVELDMSVYPPTWDSVETSIRPIPAPLVARLLNVVIFRLWICHVSLLASL